MEQKSCSWIVEGEEKMSSVQNRTKFGAVHLPVDGLFCCQMVLLLLALVFVVLPIRSITAADSDLEIKLLLNQMESRYASIQDYVAIFHKQERVNGKLLPEETILFKFQKPLKIYMKWIEEPHKGREALYVRGKYENKVIAHKGGFFGFLTVSLDPKGRLAMKGNRHPITDAGLGHLIKGLQKDILAAMERNEFDVIRMGQEQFLGRSTLVIEARSDSRGPRKYYASRMILHVDKELMIPIGVAFYDEEGELFERYAYTNLKINVGLIGADFSRDNKAYGF